MSVLFGRLHHAPDYKGHIILLVIQILKSLIYVVFLVVPAILWRRDARAVTAVWGTWL
jgi:hypothetical protein